MGGGLLLDRACYAHSQILNTECLITLRKYRGSVHGQNELNGIYFLSKSYYKSISEYRGVLKYGESNAMGRSLNTCQRPQTAR